MLTVGIVHLRICNCNCNRYPGTALGLSLSAWFTQEAATASATDT